MNKPPKPAQEPEKKAVEPTDLEELVNLDALGTEAEKSFKKMLRDGEAGKEKPRGH